MIQFFQVFFKQAELCTHERILIICDRGAMDPSAYMDSKLWNKIIAELKFDQFSLREGRYDQVIKISIFNNYANLLQLIQIG